MCNNTCPQSTYTTGLTCTPCPSRCLDCNSSTYCSDCVTTGGSQGYLNSATNLCVASTSCPVGTYAQSSNHTCSPCGLNCTTCTGTAVYCTSCAGSYYLYSGNNTCATTCPVQNYYANTATHTCSSCANICLVCSGTPTNCTACTPTGANTAYLFASNNTCLTSCPNNYY